MINFARIVPLLMLLAGSTLHAVPAGAEGLAATDCLGCHTDKTLKREAGPQAGTSVYVAEDALKGSPHEGLNCIDCHADVKELPHPAKLAAPACAACHDDAAKELGKSVHGLAAAGGNADAPGCADCHGKHQIKPKKDPDSPINPKNVSVTCARCHSNPDTVKRNHFNIIDPLKDYKTSVHYQAVQDGLGAATCSECHNHHLILKSENPASNTFKTNIPKTCGKCHGDVQKVYGKSVHGQALARGVMDSPTCTDCHGEHATKSPEDPTSSVYPKNISRTTCPRCHDNAKMMSKYGIETSRFLSYNDSYHGLALKGDLLVTANCASCHGIHDILPSSDPESSVSPGRLVKTCGKCHPSANDNFVKFTVHASESPANPVEWLAEAVRWIYIVLIILTIGGMLAHNAVIFFYYLREKIRRRRLEQLNVRFSPFEVINHLVLVLTFTALVVTGFALKFPDVFWVKALSAIGLHETLRSVIHRIAGLILILQGLVQTLWTFGTDRGRKEFWALMPVFSDLEHLIHNMLFHLGLTKEHPHFDRYTYIEKSEYWAMAWGTIVMAFTGLMLWFPVVVTWFMPAWIVKIAEIVHYYEAWLATLAILVWHMFFTYFHPEEYPLSLTWIDGKISDRELRRHHPKEFEDLKWTAEDKAEEDEDDRS